MALQKGGFGGPNVPVSGGWAQVNPLFTGNPNSVTGLQCTFPVAETFTVQFEVSPPANAVPVFSAQALISWMVEGNKVTRRVDVGQGVSISGRGQGVNITLQDVTQDPSVAGFAFGSQYFVTVLAAPGVRASNSLIPTLLALRAEQLNAGNPNTGAINIPQDAGVISVEVALLGPAGTTASVIFFPAPLAAPIKAYTLTCGETPEFVAVPPGAVFLVVANDTPATPISATITFGIDG